LYVVKELWNWPVVMGNPNNILDFEGVDEAHTPGPPLIFIPTTAGTSADVSQFAIIDDGQPDGWSIILKCEPRFGSRNGSRSGRRSGFGPW
jgi:Iron-containing alcohol dehydrogenase